jgi:hypothetical protein
LRIIITCADQIMCFGLIPPYLPSLRDLALEVPFWTKN